MNKRLLENAGEILTARQSHIIELVLLLEKYNSRPNQEGKNYIYFNSVYSF